MSFSNKKKSPAYDVFQDKVMDFLGVLKMHSCMRLDRAIFQTRTLYWLLKIFGGTNLNYAAVLDLSSHTFRQKPHRPYKQYLLLVQLLFVKSFPGLPPIEVDVKWMFFYLFSNFYWQCLGSKLFRLRSKVTELWPQKGQTFLISTFKL